MTDDTHNPGTSEFRINEPGDSVEAAIELVLHAEDYGDWKPVAGWLARHPEAAQEVAEFLDNQAKMQFAVAPVVASAPVPVGKTIGGFELLEEIGRGGAGVVYRARDLKLPREVALKLVRTGEASANERARFQYEATMVASLQHPNIVPVLSYGEDGAVPYLVMPLMTGGTLADRLKRLGPDRCQPGKDAAEIVRDVALGVHHAHQRGLIHRDLKPANILLDDAGAPHVADFGLARQLDVTLSQSGTIAGTVSYMAPEQARGEPVLTTAVDVHALGVMLFELLTGRTPFGGGDMASILRRVIEDPASPVRQFRPDVERDLEAICLKCLEKQAEDRYASAQEVADELGRYLRGEAVQARPPGFWDWLRQLARTHPEPNTNYNWPVTVWFGAAILVANAIIYTIVRTGGSALGVWAANVAAAVSMTVVLWWYMLRRFRQLPITERHSLIIAVGKILVYFPLLVAYAPLSSAVPARDAMGLYPPLGALSGLAFFILGSTNWSRFFLVGLGMMALVPPMVWWPEESPLIYGGAIAFILWYWSIAKKDGFGYKPDESRLPASG